MQGHQEIVWQIKAEKGSVAIERLHESSGDFFFIRIEGIEEGKFLTDAAAQQPFASFQNAFQYISGHYAWYVQLLTVVHDDYRQDVVDELLYRLNRFTIDPIQLSRILHGYRDQLHIQLEYGPVRLTNGLQRIRVINLMKLTEHEYHEFSDHYARESGQKFRVRGTYEVWTDEQQYSYNHNEIIRHKQEFEVVGRLEVTGSTVIIRDEFDAIAYVFSSDKYLVKTSPILGKTSRWHYHTV
jgi:hypothetical protein